jgi:hypothetical protein
MPDHGSPHGRPPGRSMLRGELLKYFGSGERPLYCCRCHLVVLEFPLVVWLVSGVLYALGRYGLNVPVPRGIARGVLLAGSGFFAWRIADWRKRRYVLTNVRVLLVEGVFSRRVRGLLLRLVIDTTYYRTLWGRLFGYGNLELNLSGQPGLRTLAMLPHPDVMYRWIVSLTGDGEVTLLEPTE